MTRPSPPGTALVPVMFMRVAKKKPRTEESSAAALLEASATT